MDIAAEEFTMLTPFVADVDISVEPWKKLFLHILRTGRQLGKLRILFTVVGVLPT
jgi:hypothetical protein